MATLLYDLVVFGTGSLIIYEDFENVIHCYNPCLGEYYVDNDGHLRPVVFYREFTYTVAQTVEQFGLENCSPTIQRLYTDGAGANLTRELIVAHGIEPNEGPDYFGVDKTFKFREFYWEWGGSTSPQGGSAYPAGFLRKHGFYEQPHIVVRWDLVSNDPYGRSPGMDALPDTKQLQQESRRKAQALDKMVNPPLVADMQLKNQPASLLPGGITYVSGYTSSGKPGFSSVYDTKFPVNDVVADLAEIRQRIQRTFFNDILAPISQYETRSNITAQEVDARRAESLVMLGPVLDRLYHEGGKQIIERTFAIMRRAGILPPAPAEIQGRNIDIEFVSMLATAQNAAAASGIERLFGIVGNLSGVDPAAMDNVDVDYGLEKYSSLMGNDPKLTRSPAELAQIRQMRQQQQQQEQQAQQAEMAQKYAQGAKVLSDTPTSGGRNMLQQMIGQ
jgi:Bacteriophage head to tail connecting protein